jgi:hypothetical protein
MDINSNMPENLNTSPLSRLEKKRVLLPQFEEIIAQINSLAPYVAHLELEDNYKSSHKAMLGLSNSIFKLNDLQKQIKEIYVPLKEREEVLKERKRKNRYR